MIRDELVAVTDARVKLTELVDEVLPQRNVVLLRRNKAVAVMIEPERYERLLETIENLEDQLSVAEAEANPHDRTSLEEFKSELADQNQVAALA